MSEPKLVFNGIDGKSGQYSLAPLTLGEFAAAVASTPALNDDVLEEFRETAIQCKEHSYIAMYGVDTDDLAQTGWAVIFPEAEADSEAAGRREAIRAALTPLLDRRKGQANSRYREINLNVDRTGDKQEFLYSFKAGKGVVDPDVFPYYVLLVASPEEISFDIQYQLAVQYAVGRICFDTVAEYAHYAASVVAAETREQAPPPTAVFFAPSHPGDAATTDSAKNLVEPLASFAAHDAHGCGWTIKEVLRDDATKSALSELLGGKSNPAFLFAAPHGVAFPVDDEYQRHGQGALVCREWDGPLGRDITSAD